MASTQFVVKTCGFIIAKYEGHTETYKKKLSIVWRIWTRQKYKEMLFEKKT